MNRIHALLPVALLGLFFGAGCGASTQTTQTTVIVLLPSQQTPSHSGPGALSSVVTPPLPQREGWAGISLHYAQSWDGWSADGTRFAACFADQCELHGAGAVETLAGTLEDTDGRRDEGLFAALRARGFPDAPEPAPAVSPRADAYEVAWSQGTITLGGVETSRIDVALRVPTTGRRTLVASFEAPEGEQLMLWFVGLSPDGQRLALVADGLRSGKQVRIVEVGAVFSR